jgi:hypothetical protein
MPFSWLFSVFFVNSRSHYCSPMYDYRPLLAHDARVVILPVERAQKLCLQRIFTWANFLHLIVNKSVKCDFLKEPSGYKPLIMEKSNT